MADLPPGFVLDDGAAGAGPTGSAGSGAPGLPPGFQLDAAPAAPSRAPGFLDKLVDGVTGHMRTEFPDAPEFHSVLMDRMAARRKAAGTDKATIQGPDADLSKSMASGIVSTPEAQVDILKRMFPGIEVTQDKHKNFMVRLPDMDKPAYVNKPGASARDLDEFLTQTIATAPFLGFMGVGKTVAQRAATGAAGNVLAEFEKDLVGKVLGSEHSKSAGEYVADAALGGALAPGVPSAIVKGAADVGRAVTAPITNAVRRVTNPQAEAERAVAQTYRQHINDVSNASEAPAGDVANSTRRMSGGDADRMTPEQLRANAANDIQIRDALSGGNGDAAVIDVLGERGRALARSAANNDPAARERLMQFTNNRFEAQAPRVQAAIEDLGGGNLAGRSREALQEMGYEARTPFYNAAFDEGRRGVQLTRNIDDLTRAPAVQDAMRRADIHIQNKEAAGRLRTGNLAPDGRRTLEYWDLVKRDLNDQYTALADRRPGEAGDMLALVRRLTGELDRQFPSYSQARGISSHVFRANNALDAGENFSKGRVSVVEAGRAVGEYRGLEQQLFRQGFISSELQKINTIGDRRNLANSIMSSPETRERFELVLGTRGMRQLEAILRNENVLDLARSAVQGNSSTARQLMELGLAGGVGGMVSGFDPSNPAGWLAAIVTKYGAGRANAKFDGAVAQKIAELLTSRDPAAIQRGAQLAQAHKPFFEALRRADEALSGVGRNIAINEASP